MCVFWCCPDETQLPSCWPKLGASGRLLPSDSPFEDVLVRIDSLEQFIVNSPLSISPDKQGNLSRRQSWFRSHLCRRVAIKRNRFCLKVAVSIPLLITSHQKWVDFVTIQPRSTNDPWGLFSSAHVASKYSFSHDSFHYLIGIFGTCRRNRDCALFWEAALKKRAKTKNMLMILNSVWINMNPSLYYWNQCNHHRYVQELFRNAMAPVFHDIYILKRKITRTVNNIM